MGGKEFPKRIQRACTIAVSPVTQRTGYMAAYQILVKEEQDLAAQGRWRGTSGWVHFEHCRHHPCQEHRSGLLKVVESAWKRMQAEEN